MGVGANVIGRAVPEQPEQLPGEPRPDPPDRRLLQGQQRARGGREPGIVLPEPGKGS